MQLPLPGHLDGQMMIDAIRPEKDVDGFHPMNVGKLYTAAKIEPERMLIPCTPLGSLMMLRDTLGPGGLAGKTAVVVGRSNIVGKPMAQLLLASDCTVTIAHSAPDLPAVCREADILVAAVGRPEMVKGDWIREGATVDRCRHQPRADRGRQGPHRRRRRHRRGDGPRCLHHARCPAASAR